MKRSPSHPQLSSKEIIWNCGIAIIPNESQTKIHLDGVESNNMDAGADFVSVICILELMQCLSQMIARKAVRKGTTKQTSAAFESEDLKKYENRGKQQSFFPTHDCLDAQLPQT